MQRVPQIRLFSSGDSWRKPRGSYEKKFIETWTSQKSTQYQPYSAKTQYTSFQRSSSVQQKGSLNPFQTNYYANAIKICEQNRVLNNVKSHVVDGLNSMYIIKGCRAPVKKQCRQCQAELKQNYLNQSFENKPAISPYKSITPKNNSSVAFEQTIHRTEHQSITSYLNNQLSSNNSNYLNVNVNVNEMGLPKYANSNKKPMKFQQIIENNDNNNNIVQENTFRQGGNVNKEQSQVLKQINTRRSQQQSDINTKPTQNNQLLPQISHLIHELNVIGIQSDLQSTSYMIGQLQDVANKQLQVRKNCISKLDEIIGKYGSRDRSINGQTGHIVMRGLELSFGQQENIDGEMEQSTKRRNRIFV